MSWQEHPTLINSIRAHDFYVFVDETGTAADYKSFYKKIQKDPDSIGLNDDSSFFSLSAVFMPGKESIKTEERHNQIKDNYFGDHCFPFHNKEINGQENQYGKLSSGERRSLEKDIKNSLLNSKYLLEGYGVNKKLMYIEMSCESEKDSFAGVSYFYSQVFININKAVKSLKKTATVILESVDPSFDKKVHAVFIKMKELKLIKNLRGGLYFSKKKSGIYPAGMEIADLNSRAINKHFRNFELAQVVSKLHHYPKDANNPLKVIEYKKTSTRLGRPLHAGS